MSGVRRQETSPDRACPEWSYLCRVRDERKRQRTDLGAWLCSTDARAAATSELRRARLPHGHDQVDDVLSEIGERVLARIDREPLELGNDSSVAAYARRALSNAAIDLVRGHHHASLEDLLDQGYEPADDASDSTDTDADDRIGVDPTALARALHRAMSPPHRRSIWSVAAALVVIALSSDQVRPAADIPSPDARHGGAADPNRWAALAYAGQGRCFVRPETGAIRERRSRAIAHLDRTLRTAAELLPLPVSEDVR